MTQLAGPVGVIGLREMGSAIVSRLLSQGARVLGLDAMPNAGHFDSPHFERVCSVAEIAAACDTVLVIVHTDEQVQDLVSSEGGLAEVTRTGTTVVIHSTVDPRTCSDVAMELARRKVAVIDAGMSRGRGSMRNGSLTLFVGGELATVEVTRPLFSLYSDNLVHAGPVGHGMVLKLCNNLLLHANRLAMLEVAHIAAAAGVEREPLLTGVRSSTGTSWVLEHWGEKDECALRAGSTTTRSSAALSGRSSSQ